MEEARLNGRVGDEPVELIIYRDSQSDYLNLISDLEAENWGEANVQLQENCSYHYKISEGFQLREVPRLISPFTKPDNNRGLIKPGNYTGTLAFTGYKISEPARTAIFIVEIRSKKTDYRTEYRLMLEEITNFSIDLVLRHSSPIVQAIAPNYDLDHRSLYQKFAFINSIIGTDEFFEAVNRIIRSPVTQWTSTEVTSDIRKSHKFSRKTINQFASNKSRVPVPSDLQSHILISSLPSRITYEVKEDSIDTPENQFVKHVLTEYFLICQYVKDKLLDGSREKIEAEILTNRLRNVISQDLFKSVSRPRSLALNSPVLQKKEGYREVFKSWLMFDLGSKLTWSGGDGVFIAGKKDIAKLYEYWVYFKLLRIIAEVFPDFSDCFSELIKPSNDGLELNLNAGFCTRIQRVCKYATREIEVEFCYNQTFSGTDDENYPKKGSWTRTMRPDYTLSFWPVGFSQQEAEEQELIVHIHFDAKYRVDNITEAFGPKDNERSLDEIDNDEEIRDFQRMDLIKMHAYKDAIRRTAGAYILYPGTENKIWRGYHEIIPGLGAFTLRPAKGNEGSAELKEFLEKVLDQLLNRASKYEETTYHIFATQSSPSIEVREKLPEKYDEKRVRPPADERCLIGFVKDQRHMEWIEKNGLYNIRLTSREEEKETEKFSLDFSDIRYLLLHDANGSETKVIFDIKDPKPITMSKEELERKSYPNPRHDHYLVFSIRQNSQVAFQNVIWNLKDLDGFPKGRASSSPFVTTLAKLMKATVREE
ncbi:MAG: DUF2357 domain-containing protein [Erysipelotrichaceae bacterium]|nr:DUF2357 domain-containing protein [Erysipelotrichaceae bacterium]